MGIVTRAPNGWRYPLVGGTRQRHFAGDRVHIVLGNGFEMDPD